ncbi:MAG: antitoxin Xre/MbcA/ParS toxin-binding domain-containing protein [Bacteroidota bacterium]
MVQISQLLSDESRNIKIQSPFDYIELSRKGLTVKQLHDILDYTKISIKELPKIISLSERQINRYTKDKALRTDISAQLIQIVELYNKGYELFEDEEKFQLWMSRKIRGLGNMVPKKLLDTTFGIQLIIDELGRLEHGIIS